MNYSQNAYDCRVTFWRADPHGRPRKWYAEEAISWEGLYNEPLIEKAFEKALSRAGIGGEGRFNGMIAVCEDPYHINSYPIITQVDW